MVNPENSPKLEPAERSASDFPEFQNPELTATEILEKTDFVAKNYGDKLDFFIDNLYEDYDDSHRDDPERYVYKLSFEQICPEEKQTQFIKDRAAGKSIQDAEIMQNLMHALLNSDLKDEVIKDPFLRQKHQDYLTRDLKDNSYPDELTELIWGFDRDFGETTNAMAVLFDPDYLERTYPGYTPESIKAFINDAIFNGKLTSSEILNDPYLRHRRTRLHLENPDALNSDNEWVNIFWSLDKDFHTTSEHGKWIDISTAAHPEVYQVSSEDPEVVRITSEVLDQVSDQDLRQITKAYQTDWHAGDEKLREILLGPLGLTHCQPELRYQPGGDKKELAAYIRSQNLISINEEKFATPSRRLIDRFLRPKLDDPLFERIQAVSHELWHAHQKNGENVDSEHRQKYDFNFECYYDARHHNDEDRKARYKGQLIEAEAFTFGEAIGKRARELWYN